MHKETILSFSVNCLIGFLLNLSVLALPDYAIAQTEDKSCSLRVVIESYSSIYRSHYKDESSAKTVLSLLALRLLAEKKYVLTESKEFAFHLESTFIVGSYGYTNPVYKPELKVNLYRKEDHRPIYSRKSSGEVRCETSMQFKDFHSNNFFDTAFKPFKWLANFNSRCDNNMDVLEFIHKRKDKILDEMIAELPNCEQAKVAPTKR